MQSAKLDKINQVGLQKVLPLVVYLNVTDIKASRL